jgi:hypothetical protein
LASDEPEPVALVAGLAEVALQVAVLVEEWVWPGSEQALPLVALAEVEAVLLAALPQAGLDDSRGSADLVASAGLVDSRLAADLRAKVAGLAEEYPAAAPALADWVVALGPAGQARPQGASPARA